MVDRIDIEGDINQFIQTVFTKEPIGPNQYILNFDWTTTADTETNKDKVCFIFKELLYIFTEGMKIRHGDDSTGTVKVNLDQISPTDFHKMAQYFASFGFKVMCEITDVADYIGTNEPTNNTDQLKDYFFTITTASKVYIISFDVNV